MSMTAWKRREQICELLKEGKPLSVTELCMELSVSSMTIRRDLEALQDLGKLRRARGWAEPVRTDEYEPAYNLRIKENAREKAAISRAAVELVQDGEVIVIDVGTTLSEFCRLLGRTRRVTVLTYWLPHVLELAKHQNIRTIVLGGTLRQSELSVVGSLTGEALAGFNADKAFLSVGGVSLEKGLTDYNLDEVEVKRAVIQMARQVIVVADHTKLERVAPIRIASYNAMDVLVTEAGKDDRRIESFRSSGIRMIEAPIDEAVSAG